MTTYLSPGVYVKEVPSGLATIAGVGTSTAGFIGIISPQGGSSDVVPPTQLRHNGTGITGNQDTNNKTYSFTVESSLDFGSDPAKYKFLREGDQPTDPPVKLTIDSNHPLNIASGTGTVGFNEVIPVGKKLLATYSPPDQPSPQPETPFLYALQQKSEVVGKGDGTRTVFKLGLIPVNSTHITVKVGEEKSAPDPQVTNDLTNQVSTITFTAAPKKDSQISVDYTLQSVAAGNVKLCTNFTEFKNYFGDFSAVEGRSNLAHAVYGFFRNGGTRCFVTWVAAETGIDDALADFAAIDEISIVAVPGCISKTVLDKLSAHCLDLGDRVAIFDAPNDANATNLNPGEGNVPGRTNYAALYYPWIKVFDPPTKDANPKGDGLKVVPPSGHIAGIYARVDTQRGVHKAPANEVIIGATDLQVALTRSKQDGLNPQGVNCLRNLNGNILVWGARTWGGDANGEFKYINVRRLFNFLRESIDEGTQWAVFEPNSPELWAKIRRSVTAFLTTVWRSGALFGATPQEAFFVQCDAETNPPEVRNAGQLIVKVGVAVVKPAEFVIFELSQMSGGK